MDSQIVTLLRSRPFVTSEEAASVLQVPEDDVRSALDSIVQANAGAYALLSGGVDEAARGDAVRVVMRKVDSLSCAATKAPFAVMSMTYPSRAAASAQPIALLPSACDTLRVYPVVSRAAMEARKDDAPRPAPVFVSLSAPAAPAAPKTEVKLEATKSPVAAPVSPVVAAAPPAPPATLAPAALASQPAAREPSPPHLPVLVAAEATSPTSATAPPTVVVKVENSATPPQVPAAVEAPRKPTIFDKMKEAAASKRPREAEEAPAKAKKASAAAARPKKAAKTEHTTSLAKLARASKKKAGAAPTAAPSSQNFLDEDDGDAMNGFSTSEESTRAETMVQEETPMLDVVEVSASNDDVILCDDAPPLAFRPAEPITPATAAAKKDAPAKKPSTAAAAGEGGAAQCTLGAFFNSAVVDFQKSYVRDVQTEMKVENGEYVCVDVVCYKHKTTGEIISGDEYHKRSAQLLQSQPATPNHKSAGAQADSPVSPAAAAPAKSGSRSPNEKTDNVKVLSAPAKTLLSFFKPAA